MRRKICSIGNSRGVSIPVEILEALNLSTGSEVDVKLDKDGARIIIEPVEKREFPEELDREFISQVNDFIEKYRPALEELANK